MNSCVFPGRFQPFHNGHLMVIKGMVKLCSRVVIVVCASQKSGTDDNPFSAEDRKDMIQQTLQAEDLIPKYDIEFREVEDMENDSLWVEEVIRTCGEVDVVWTGDEQVQKCFQDVGVEVKEIKEVPGISGEDIRAKLKAEDKSWTQQVPGEVMKFIDK